VVLSESFVANGDGVVIDSGGNGACGGVVRDHEGMFFVGFSYSMFYCSCLIAKLWAVVKVLELVIGGYLTIIIVESDTSEAM
jgi:hypothetical protein